jgi:hypothetical protein
MTGRVDEKPALSAQGIGKNLANPVTPSLRGVTAALMSGTLALGAEDAHDF